MHSAYIKQAHTVHIVAGEYTFQVWYMVGDGAWKLGYDGQIKRAAWNLAKLATEARISVLPRIGARGNVVQEYPAHVRARLDAALALID